VVRRYRHHRDHAGPSKLTEDKVREITLKNGKTFADLVHNADWVGYGGVQTPTTGWDRLDPETQPAEIVRKYSKTLVECIDRSSIDAANATDPDTEE